MLRDKMVPSDLHERCNDGLVAGVLYRDTTFIEALSEKDDAAAYFVELGGAGGAVETRLEPRRL